MSNKDQVKFVNIHYWFRSWELSSSGFRAGPRRDLWTRIGPPGRELQPGLEHKQLGHDSNMRLKHTRTRT